MAHIYRLQQRKKNPSFAQNRRRDFLPLSSVDVLRGPCEPIKQQEDVSTACNPVTEPGSLLQQAFLPHQLPTADARVQILGLLIDQVGLSKEVRHACVRAARSDQRGLQL